MTDNDLIHPLELARYMELPGAGRALKALAKIPEGKLREASILQLEAIAENYEPAPQLTRPPASAMRVIEHAAKPPKEPKTDSPEAAAIKMRIAGKMPAEIAQALNRRVSWVYSVLGDARKAGVPIPKLGEGKPRLSQSGTRWTTDVSQLNPQGLRLVQKAADERGITAEAYIERRQIALRLAMAGAGWKQILRETGEKNAKKVSAWMSNARAAGFAVPYIATEKPEIPPEPAAPHPAQAPAEAAGVSQHPPAANPSPAAQAA
jgi:hypothetical protein